MTPPRRLLALPLLLALTACGSATGATAGAAAPDSPSAGGAAAGACLEGTTDCDDTPGATGDGGVQSGADGSVPVGDALAAGIQGPFLVSGFLVADPGGARLCDALAESFPPQCGGSSVPLEPSAVPSGVATTTEGDVTWSEEPVLVEGELVDGAFVVRAG